MHSTTVLQAMFGSSPYSQAPADGVPQGVPGTRRAGKLAERLVALMSCPRARRLKVDDASACSGELPD
jgi:hypothetical protein